LGDSKATTAAVDLHESLYFLQHVSHSLDRYPDLFSIKLPRLFIFIFYLWRNADTSDSVDKMLRVLLYARAEGSINAREMEWQQKYLTRESVQPT
jgi:hypothetical protein